MIKFTTLASKISGLKLTAAPIEVEKVLSV
jgi:hypothetical protein